MCFSLAVEPGFSGFNHLIDWCHYGLRHDQNNPDDARIEIQRENLTTPYPAPSPGGSEANRRSEIFSSLTEKGERA
jgi:hypothetical protein